MAYIDDELFGDEVKPKGAPAHQPRFRQLMIGIGFMLLALALAVLVFFLYVVWQLHAVYGPGGELDQERRKSALRTAAPRGLRDHGPWGGQGFMPRRSVGLAVGGAGWDPWAIGEVRLGVPCDCPG
jgi:hypothetical protein